MDQAKVGDLVACSCKGGPHKVVEGATSSILGGMPVARVGDKCSCGATITSGLGWFLIEGQSAAIDGSTTSCGGEVIASSSSKTGVPAGSDRSTISNLNSILKNKYNEKLRLLDPRGIPFAYQNYAIVRQDGTKEYGKTNGEGVTHLVKDHNSPEKIKVLLIM
ncbi:PAAR domain-containing protein [Vreelandella populi]|uniref:PAAR domain-containing protein n=1 Tax=Vreelandella populi TaxID=2498858 RepID=UPI001C8D1A04|nr:PAAR domain-containing protein [Halomonas populi]